MISKRTKIFCQHLNKNPAQNGLMPRDTSASEAVGTEFLYTLNNSRLSWYQRKFYDDNGFLLIRRLVDDDVLDACSRRFVDICEGRVPKGNMILMKDISLINTGATGEFLYNKVQDIVWDEVMTKYIFLPKLPSREPIERGVLIDAEYSGELVTDGSENMDCGAAQAVERVFGAVGANAERRRKGRTDLHYFPFRPADRIVAAWTAMERVTMDNGCLVVIPGTHKGKLEEHDYPETENGVNKGYHGVKGFEDLPLVTLEMEKGDTVFFHPKLIHGSGVNRTKVGIIASHELSALFSLDAAPPTLFTAWNAPQSMFSEPSVTIYPLQGHAPPRLTLPGYPSVPPRLTLPGYPSIPPRLTLPEHSRRPFSYPYPHVSEHNVAVVVASTDHLNPHQWLHGLILHSRSRLDVDDGCDLVLNNRDDITVTDRVDMEQP
uniref:phytanoyl-CoA dioxygenase n=1 Tax=Timema genevievae TaxID=629358 RepID=A0A7R9PRN4_TIMGE|nr:unnamed protein product [Timema genevievae]